jgi:glyoxylase-like metal-dependent hydrolase (beta-lactamase superfamily II)
MPIDWRATMPSPQVQAFFDTNTNTFSYVVYGVDTQQCAIIDSVLDYDPKSGRITTDSADDILAFIDERELEVEWILETHAHADHLSAASYIQEQVGGRIAIGEHICEVQRTFQNLFNLQPPFQADGSQFDHLFHDGEQFFIGKLAATALHVPGHTPADMAYHIDGLGVFIGDTLFMPDVGTARCDFPGGDAPTLYRSIQRILTLGDATRLFLCHDYPPDHRARQCCCTVREQRYDNIHVNDDITEEDFIAMREARDKTLELPVLMLPAVQLNINAGRRPEPDDNGIRYFKIPLDQL